MSDVLLGAYRSILRATLRSQAQDLDHQTYAEEFDNKQTTIQCQQESTLGDAKNQFVCFRSDSNDHVFALSLDGVSLFIGHNFNLDCLFFLINMELDRCPSRCVIDWYHFQCVSSFYYFLNSDWQKVAEQLLPPPLIKHWNQHQSFVRRCISSGNTHSQHQVIIPMVCCSAFGLAPRALLSLTVSFGMTTGCRLDAPTIAIDKMAQMTKER